MNEKWITVFTKQFVSWSHFEPQSLQEESKSLPNTMGAGKKPNKLSKNTLSVRLAGLSLLSMILSEMSMFGTVDPDATNDSTNMTPSKAKKRPLQSPGQYLKKY